MSSSGTTPSNTGPLIIRTYNSVSSNNNTYVLSDYDIPVASNLVLITSTNGRVVPSSAPRISTATFSSIQISSLFDRDGLLGTTGEVLHTNGSQIYWAPSGAGSGYWSEAGNKIFNNNGSGAGFVGVNTINPSSNLHVNGSFQVITDNELQPFLSNTTQNYLFVKPGNNGFVNLGAFNTGTGSKPLVLQLESGGAAGGNVGINVSSPQFMLDVAGSIRASTLVSTNIINTNRGQILGLSSIYAFSSTLDINGNIFLTGDFNSKSNNIYIDLIGTDLVVKKSTINGGAGTTIENSAATPLIVGTILGNSTSTRNFIYFQNGGVGQPKNVGINTTTPQFMFDVAGSIRASTFLSTNLINMNNGNITTDKLIISSTNPTDNTGAFKVELTGSNFLVYKSTMGAVTPATVLSNSGSGALALGTTNPNLFITGTNVGINTSTPQSILDVQGQALTKQIVTSSLTTNIGASGNWSNYYGKYVFVSTTNTLTLPTTGVSEGSVLIFRNLDLTNSLTINNCFTGGSPIPSNGAASFIFTTLYGGSTWVSM